MNSSQQASVALITGAAKRLGAATAKALHKQGYSVAIHYRQSKSDAEALCAELNAQRTGSAVCIPARLEVIEEVEALAHTTLQHFSRCDVLINNASAYYSTPLPQATTQHWDELFASNAKAPYFLSKYLAQELSQRKGAIVNIADIHAQRPKNLYSIYCMAKAANMMMTKSLALELSPHVRVNGIAPGAALWPENAEGEALEDPKELAAVPLKSLGGSESIVETILFLVQQAQYITGQCVNVDGGRTLIQ
ncbi:MAG: pteridine reductase [Cellvibrionaceae bacterium]|nr:pteridine reductase [Cellvibrionaceae bacterium]